MESIDSAVDDDGEEDDGVDDEEKEDEEEEEEREDRVRARAEGRETGEWEGEAEVVTIAVVMLFITWPVAPTRSGMLEKGKEEEIKSIKK